MSPARFLFFAQAADWMNAKEITIALPEPAPLRTILQNDPRFGDLCRRVRFLRVAVNHQMSNFDREVGGGDEVAFFPPFSGG